MNSRKTTTAGIAVILTGVATAATEYSHSGTVNVAALIGAIAGGLGLILSQDAGTPPAPPAK